MQPQSEKFFTHIGKAGSNVVAPHKRWAELAKRMHDTEHAGDDTTKEKLSSDNGTLPAELV